MDTALKLTRSERRERKKEKQAVHWPEEESEDPLVPNPNHTAMGRLPSTLTRKERRERKLLVENLDYTRQAPRSVKPHNFIPSPYLAAANPYDQPPETAVEGPTASTDDTQVGEGFTEDDTDTGKLFVKGIKASVTEQQLRRVFEPFGTIRGVSFKGSFTVTGKTWFAFVQYEDYSSGAAAVNFLNQGTRETPVGRLSVQFAQKPARGEELRETDTIWFENFDSRTTDTEISNMFSAFGTVVSCHGKIDNPDRGGRCGYVRFQTPSQAKRALKGMRSQDTQVRVKLWTRPKNFELVEKIRVPKQGKGLKASRNLGTRVDDDGQEMYANADLSAARLRRSGPAVAKSSNVTIIESAPVEERAGLIYDILLKQVASKRPALATRIVNKLMCLPAERLKALLDSPNQLSIAVEDAVELLLDE